MRWIVPFLLLAALGGLAWLALSMDPSTTTSIERVSAEDAARVEPAATPSSEDERPAPIAESSAARTAAPAPPPGPDAAQDVAAVEPEALEPGGLRVRVVDATGAPAPNVDVVLNLKVKGMGEDDRGRATTRAPDGLARIELEGLERLKAQVAAMDMKVEFAVAARLATAEPVEKVLDAWPTDGTEVELVLPPTGSVLVHVVHADGRAVEGEVSVGWWWLPADVVAAEPNSGYERVKRHFIEGTDGTARVDGVGLGLALSLQASVYGYTHASQRGVLGPTQAGEVVEVTMTLGRRMAKIQLRVLDADGAPVASEKVWGEQWDDPDRERHAASGPLRGSSFSLTTDEDGIASFLRVPSDVEIERRLDVTRGGRGSAAQDDPDWSLGSTWLPKTVEPGAVHDLGDVRLDPARVLVEGDVVDQGGAPLRRVSLRFQERYGSTREHGWYNLETLRTDNNGHFRLRALRVPHELGVLVFLKGYEGQTIRGLEIGDTAMLIELEAESPEPKHGSVALEVLMDDDVPFMRCLLKFRREGGGGRSPDWWAGAPIEIDRLSPGTYDVYVETRDGDFELGRVSGVVVAAGETTRDARLAPFDLRGTAHTVSLRVVRPDDSPWRRRDLSLTALGHGRSFWEKTDDTGTVELILPSAVTSIRVSIDETHTVSVGVPASSEEPIRVELAE